MPKSAFSGRYDHFRSLLAQARKRSGLTQAELAKMLGRPQSFVSKYERGERRLDVVEFLDVAPALKLDTASTLSKIDVPSRKGSA